MRGRLRVILGQEPVQLPARIGEDPGALPNTAYRELRPAEPPLCIVPAVEPAPSTHAIPVQLELGEHAVVVRWRTAAGILPDDAGGGHDEARLPAHR